jgi:hypothetical protein
MLGHPVFRDKIREWLKVLRKANCAVVLATQSISDAERSGIIDVLKESCPTKICLPNGAAREPGTRSSTSASASTSARSRSSQPLSQSANTTSTSPDGRRLFDMALGPSRSPSSAPPARSRPEADPGTSVPNTARTGRSIGFNERRSSRCLTISCSEEIPPTVGAFAAVGASAQHLPARRRALRPSGRSCQQCRARRAARKSSGLQVDNQLTQISQLAEQIQNQLNIYENMLQNTAQLPDPHLGPGRERSQPAPQYRRSGTGHRLLDGQCR